MTGQEVLDTVVQGLRKQGKRSIGDDHGCAYRGPSGTKCAAGMLISDEEYVPEMENVTFGSPHPAFSWPPRLMEHASLIGHLQNWHDCYSNWFPEDRMTVEGIEYIEEALEFCKDLDLSCIAEWKKEIEDSNGKETT